MGGRSGPNSPRPRPQSVGASRRHGLRLGCLGRFSRVAHGDCPVDSSGAFVSGGRRVPLTRTADAKASGHGGWVCPSWKASLPLARLGQCLHLLRCRNSERPAAAWHTMRPKGGDAHTGEPARAHARPLMATTCSAAATTEEWRSAQRRSMERRAPSKAWPPGLDGRVLLKPPRDPRDLPPRPGMASLERYLDWTI